PAVCRAHAASQSDDGTRPEKVSARNVKVSPSKFRTQSFVLEVYWYQHLPGTLDEEPCHCTLSCTGTWAARSCRASSGGTFSARTIRLRLPSRSTRLSRRLSLGPGRVSPSTWSFIRLSNRSS